MDFYYGPNIQEVHSLLWTIYLENLMNLCIFIKDHTALFSSGRFLLKVIANKLKYISYKQTEGFTLATDLLCIKFSEDGEDDDGKNDNGDLVASSNHSREQHGIVGRPEHVPVHLLPPILVSQVSFLPHPSKFKLRTGT